jgi:hypothetical protein
MHPMKLNNERGEEPYNFVLGIVRGKDNWQCVTTCSAIQNTDKKKQFRGIPTKNQCFAMKNRHSSPVGYSLVNSKKKT